MLACQQKSMHSMKKAKKLRKILINDIDGVYNVCYRSFDYLVSERGMCDTEMPLC